MRLRRKTRVVWVGKLGIGGHYPIRIQSMTTAKATDIKGSVEQILQLVDAGCELVRLAVPGMAEVKACQKLREELHRMGCFVPIVADTHFWPGASTAVAPYVDKVRINPGNFGDKRATFVKVEHDATSYALEMERLESLVVVLLQACKASGTALRIGVNQGSLSDRIMTRYGDGVEGMVESAIEFAQICRAHDFHNFLFSMKSSNPAVMVAAYRLLVMRMELLGWDYPLHLGVTEAGSGMEGRVRSATGTGALLLDGIGDTIRVSLTEDPWHEIPPCYALANLVQPSGDRPLQKSWELSPAQEDHKLRRRKKAPQGRFAITLTQKDLLSQNLESRLRFEAGKPSLASPDFLCLEGTLSSEALEVCQRLANKKCCLISREGHPTAARLLLLETLGVEQANVWVNLEMEKELWQRLVDFLPAHIFLEVNIGTMTKAASFFEFLLLHGIDVPVLLCFTHHEADEQALVLSASAQLALFFLAGLGDGLFLENGMDLETRMELSLLILQANRIRLFKADLISCPGCGRTLFDLQTVSSKIQKRVGHLIGVKVAVMGCIVNGPGEMADADFGYVGSGTGLINLYVGKHCVDKGIPEAQAEDRLVELIKRNDRWQEIPSGR